MITVIITNHQNKRWTLPVGLIMTFFLSFSLFFFISGSQTEYLVCGLFQYFLLVFTCQEFISSMKPEQEQINAHMSIHQLGIFGRNQRNIDTVIRTGDKKHLFLGDIMRLESNTQVEMHHVHFPNTPWSTFNLKVSGFCCRDATKGFCHGRRMWASITLSEGQSCLM